MGQFVYHVFLENLPAIMVMGVVTGIILWLAMAFRE